MFDLDVQVTAGSEVNPTMIAPETLNMTCLTCYTKFDC
ncbi:FDLD family class I lanthipeptide [Tumebacillus flagellatus]